MSKKENLAKAKQNKNDEFYTKIQTIDVELKWYREHFQGKTVLLNCDDPEYSNFWHHFSQLFDGVYNLKKLIATHYRQDGSPSYKLEIVRNEDGSVSKPIKTPLKGNGDFRSEECIELLKEADIVVTNPPFSLFREFVEKLMEYNKKFLILGNMNAISYKEIFPLLKNNEIWLGIDNGPKEYEITDKSLNIKNIRVDEKTGKMYTKLGNTCWFTNLEHYKRQLDIPLWKKYFGNEINYPKYDNSNAIEISKIKDIPEDYEGTMGVPITFLDKYNPEQFEIVGFRKGDDGKDLKVNGKDMYCRILIRNKKVVK